ncbi:hypothetical protein QCA50_011323 [Cerrena zonata]|uniref:Uncharacterized protein n=1 Tax=Cerrena zonata TaxID=2478898 RepID=A0AAW0G2X4_9APHY
MEERIKFVVGLLPTRVSRSFSLGHHLSSTATPHPSTTTQPTHFTILDCVSTETHSRILCPFRRVWPVISFISSLRRTAFRFVPPVYLHQNDGFVNWNETYQQSMHVPAVSQLS